MTVDLEKTESNLCRIKDCYCQMFKEGVCKQHYWMYSFGYKVVIPPGVETKDDLPRNAT
jgi:hypothetical protein